MGPTYANLFLSRDLMAWYAFACTDLAISGCLGEFESSLYCMLGFLKTVGMPFTEIAHVIHMSGSKNTCVFSHMPRSCVSHVKFHT